MTERFSDRESYRPTDRPITVRDDAPTCLRHAVPMIALEVGMRPSDLREEICQVLLKRPDPENWSEYPNVNEEVFWLITEVAKWYQVYDIIEALHQELCRRFDAPKAPDDDIDFLFGDSVKTRDSEHGPQPSDRFKQRLNAFLVENGIGWQLLDGQITRRGSESFERSTQQVPERLEQSGFRRAANEMREAVKDISRRPQPDSTGAIQHSMAALEAIALEFTGQRNRTMGQLVPALKLPPPLDQAVDKLWGYTSQYARHIREDRNVDHVEAELVVTVAGALCEYLKERLNDTS